MVPGQFTWSAFIKAFPRELPSSISLLPWQLTSGAAELIREMIPALGAEYKVSGDLAVHRTAQVEDHVVIKAPAIVGPHCFLAAHVYLRQGVFLVGSNSIGPGCEVKSSIIFPLSNLAHFNFVGDSVIGSGVNFEAGSIVANYFNEKIRKEIRVFLNGEVRSTGSEKFGALVGDGCKIGANAVLSPGSILTPGAVVRRLELVDQMGN